MKVKHNNFKNLILVLLTGFTIYLVFFKKTSTEPITSIDYKPVIEQVQYLKDLNDKNSAVLRQQVVDIAQAKIYSDSLARALRVKTSRIKAVDVYIYKHDTTFETKDKPYIPSPGSDTSSYFKYQDEYLNLETSTIKNKNSLHLGLVDTLTRSVIEKHKGFLGLGGTYNNVVLRNANPYVQIREGSSYTIKQKKTWLAIGPVFSYDVLTNKPSVGIGITVPFIRLNR